MANAERFNAPGRFTALIGYEWSSMPGGDNLHRVVVFGDGQKRPPRWSRSPRTTVPIREALWRYLADYEAKTGGQALAIPHNSNTSGGRMFAPVDFAGKPIDRDYAERRQRWEPLIEVTQYKGDSRPTRSCRRRTSSRTTRPGTLQTWAPASCKPMRCSPTSTRARR